LALIIKKCTVAELEAASTFEALLVGYAEESHIDGLPPPKAQMETYRLMEGAGAIQCFGAFVDDALVGLAVVLTSLLPHYGAFVSVMESIFVDRHFRKTGAGLKLLHAAEEHAAEKSRGILVSAPKDGSLAAVLERRDDYRETNRVFFKRLAA
jgi:GNAT superfamily N-acetyltransferase